MDVVKNRKMTDEKVIKLFSEKNLVFIATIMKDGSPQVSPVWANYQDGFILVNTAEGRIKHKNILRDPRVAVSVTSNENPLDMTTIRGKVVEIISDAEYSKLKKHPIIGLSPKANIKASAGFLKGAMGLYKNSVIPEKYMWLMGLAASAAMKCE